MARSTLARALRAVAAVALVLWAAQWLDAAAHSPRLRIAHDATALDAFAQNATLRLHRCHRSHDGDSFVDYEWLVYCTRLGDSLALARTALVVVLVVLLYLLSSTADSFFCPILQAIVEKYRIPPDIAGVTFLSFGNGSPDVFSNIAAFSTSTPKIGVTSILGGGLLVTTVIAASVGLASQDQDQLIPRKFIRDVVFYFLSVSYLCFVFFNGTVEFMGALGFLLIYGCYVGVIIFDHKLARLYYSIMDYDLDELDELDQGKHLLGNGYLSGASWSSSEKSASDSEDLPTTPMITAYDVYRIPNYTPGSDSEKSDSSTSVPAFPPLYRKSSAPTPRSKKSTDHSGEFAQSESVPLLFRQLTTVRRPASVCVPSLARKRPRTRSAWETTQLSAHSNLTAKRWTRWYHELKGIEEVSGVSETGEEVEEEHDVDAKSDHSRVSEVEVSSLWDRYLFSWFRLSYRIFDRFVWNPLEFITTFIRRLTIPLVDDETWDKTFAVACPPCAILLVGVSIFELDPLSDMYFALTIVVAGGAGSAAVYLSASNEVPPEGAALAPYICVAFVMSVIWIMNIANEVLALLKVLGGLFGLSNSVLGVSVLAWGNSIGDLVSNTSIARDGFPTMAFAGCFAGPMFNLLVGIGLALTIAIASRGPISMGGPSPLVYIGFAFLFTSLVLNVGMAAFDGFRYRPRLCYALYLLYAAFVVISIAAVVTDEET